MTHHDAKDSGPRSETGERDPLLDEVWDELEALPVREVGEVPDVDEAWNDLRDRLGPTEVTPARARTSARPPSRPWWRAGIGRAAAVVLLGVATAGAWALGDVRHTTAPGERATVALPDGSTVELNAGSTLRHARGFDRVPGVAMPSRRVVLEGEAFFDVVSDGRPFVVEAAGARVRVLGTAFSIRARGDEAGEVTVAVTEGEVEVVPTRVAEAGEAAVGVAGVLRGPVRLGAGEAARVGVDGRAARMEGDTDHLVAWRDGAFVAVDRPLARVVADVARSFGVEIDFRAPAAAERAVTVYYGDDVGVERVLADLATFHDLRYRRAGPDRWVLGSW